jgi:hypothetical protein
LDLSFEDFGNPFLLSFYLKDLLELY